MNLKLVHPLIHQEDTLTTANQILRDPIQSQTIPLHQWIPIAEETHLLPGFLSSLAANLDNEEKIVFSKALAVSCACDDDATLFWTLLHLYSITTYGKAITVTARIYEYPIIATAIKAILPFESSQTYLHAYLKLN